MIPVSKPWFDEKEALAVQEVLASGWVTQGPRVKAFEDAFAEYVGANHACAVSNCTVALQLGLQAVGVKPGNVVITVSHSYIATANAVRHAGGEPVFSDIDPATFNMDSAALSQLLEQECESRGGALYYRHAVDLARGESPLRMLDRAQPEFGRVTAVLIVHQMGMPADMAALMPVARQYNLPVVEDVACAIGSEIRLDGQGGGQWRRIGNPIGDVVCFSFHPRKVLTTGDGGMLTTNNTEYDKQFRLLRQHGMGVPDTVRHQAKQVIIEDYLTTGYNFRMTDIQAAVGLEQLHKLPAFLEKRRELDRRYCEMLAEIPWLEAPHQPEYARTNWQSYPVRVLPGAPVNRNELMQALLKADIATRPGIMNAHQETPYAFHKELLPRSEAARAEVLLMPLFHTMTDTDLAVIREQLIRLSSGLAVG